MSANTPLQNVEPVLIAGRWRPAVATGSFRAVDPTTGEERPQQWPVSGWSDVDAALDAAVTAAQSLVEMPGERLAAFLERYADRLAARGHDLVAVAHAESGLDVQPRLTDVELPRTLDQLRQAAAAAREGTWRMGMIDSRRNIRSAAFGLGPVVVFPPANFPLAYGAVTGGDFAAAIAGGNPVIAKAHPGNPGVSRLAAEEALAAVHDTGLPPATVQLLHGISLDDGERLVADPRVGGTGFTGGQEAGKRLYAAAAAAGRVIWVEMGSINPVVLLPGAVAERGDEIASELTASVTGSAGQFCTKPGLVLLIDDQPAATFTGAVAERFRAIGAQVLLGPVGRARLVAAIKALEDAGARVVAGGGAGDGPCRHRPTLLEVRGADLVARPQTLVIEAFGNATLLVRCASMDELMAAVACVPGALAASIYRSRDRRDDASFGPIAASLAVRAGRIIENRMPTGLAVTPPMQHGGPWPSAGPPFFSAVGMPWSILRFARRICFDGWSLEQVPECLRDKVPEGRPWRYVDAAWTRG
jgi:alpha-ketoglutaric semialdehyde dehydrogenase